jgi:hypothetical protein
MQNDSNDSANDQLDASRIRKMAALRRSAYRSRSYCLIALGGCVAGAAEFIFKAVRRWPQPSSLRGFLVVAFYLAAAVALLIFCRRLIRLTLAFHREARQTTLAEPTTPPDFSPLQDGSQTARNLEEM